MSLTKLKEKSIDFNKILYTITLVLILLRKYTISMLNEGTVPSIVLSLLFYASIALLFIQFLLRKKHNATELGLLLVACVLYVFTREGSILTIILLSISIIDIDDEYVVKSYIVTTCIFMVIAVLFGTFLPDFAQTMNAHYRTVGSDYVERQTFGFGNPNSTFLFMLPIYSGYIYLRFKKYNIYDMIILLLVTLFIYSKTMSRTGLMTIIGVLLVVEILRFVDLKKHKIIANLFRLSPVILLMLSLIISIMFANNPTLNSILASRPRHWNSYLVTDGSLFTLFGNSYPPDMREIHPLDNSYIYILSMLGVVSLIFFISILCKGIDIFIKKDEKKYLSIVMIFVVYAFAENILLEVGYNFTIFILVKHIIMNNSKYFTIKDILNMIKNGEFSIKNRNRRLKKC